MYVERNDRSEMEDRVKENLPSNATLIDFKDLGNNRIRVYYSIGDEEFTSVFKSPRAKYGDKRSYKEELRIAHRVLERLAREGNEMAIEYIKEHFVPIKDRGGY